MYNGSCPFSKVSKSLPDSSQIFLTWYSLSPHYMALPNLGSFALIKWPHYRPNSIQSFPLWTVLPGPTPNKPVFHIVMSKTLYIPRSFSHFFNLGHHLWHFYICTYSVAHQFLPYNIVFVHSCIGICIFVCIYI